MDTIHIM